MKAKNLIKSFHYAFRGFMYTVRTQRNFRIHCAAALIALAAALVLQLAWLELALLLSAVFGVLVCELMNTAIEKTIDMVTEDFNPLAMVAKNCAAAAVLLASIYALAVGLILFLPRLATLL